LHELVVDLRAWFDGCHEDVVWDLVRGKSRARPQEGAGDPRLARRAAARPRVRKVAK